MAMSSISIINACTVVTDHELAAMTAAIQKQVNGDFAPIYGTVARLTFVPKGGKPASGTQIVAVTDSADQAGALGYHDLTAQGLPLGKVFAKTTLNDGGLVSVTLSHEVLEMLADPYLNKGVLVQAGRQTTFYCYEVCDAVEEDHLGYPIDGIQVSDFVLPRWFDATARSPTLFSFKRHVNAPFALAGGGYVGVWVPNEGWTQRVADARSIRHAARAKVGSRRERRRIPLDQWLLSTAHAEVT